MTLQWIEKEIPLLQGLSGKENPKFTQGALLLENACFDELGAINKRNTYSTYDKLTLKNLISMGKYSLAYSQGTTQTNISRLLQYDDNTSAWLNRSQYLACRVGVDRQVLGCAFSFPSLRIADSVHNTNLGYYLYSNSAAEGLPNVVIKDLVSAHVVATSTPTTRVVSERFVKVGTAGNVLIGRTHTGPIWTQRDPASGTRQWNQVASDADGSVLVGVIGTNTGTTGRCYMSTDSGATWTEPRPAGDNNRAWSDVDIDENGSAQIVCCRGTNGRLYTSADTGATWTERDPPGAGATDRDWECVASDEDGSNLVAGFGASTTGGQLYTSSNSGVAWTLREPAGAGITKNWNSAASDSDGSVLLVSENLGAGTGAGGRLYLSTNSGGAWTEVRPAGNIDVMWLDVACDATGAHLVATSSGAGTGSIYTSDDGGTTWVKRVVAYSSSTFISCATDGDGSRIAVVEYGYRVWISKDYGANWFSTVPNSASHDDFNSVDFDSDGSNIIVGSKEGTDGYLFTSSNLTGTVDDVVVWKFAIDSTTGPSGAGTVLNIGNTVIPWDACWGATTKVGIAWINGSNHIQLSIYDYTNNSIDATYDTTIDADTSAALGIGYYNGIYYIVFQEDTTHTLKVTAYTSAGVQQFAPSTISTSASGHITTATIALSGTAYMLYYISTNDGGTAHDTVMGVVGLTSGTVSVYGWLPWSRLVSKAVVANETVYAWVRSELDYSGYDTNDQPGYYLMTYGFDGAGSVGSFHAQAQALYGWAFEFTPYANDLGFLPNINLQTLITSGSIHKLSWVAPYTISSSTSEAQVAEISVTMSSLLQHVEIDGSHLLTGGLLYSLHNVHTLENGFLQYPVISSLTGLAAGGSMSDGAYSVVVVQEFVDEAGQLHRSAPSDPVAITLSAGGAAQSIRVAIKNNYFGTSYKFLNCRYVVYRTAASGTTYYYAGAWGQPPSNSNLVKLTNVLITEADATIDDYQTLYTTGGVLEAVFPPAPLCLAKSSDRVFLLSADDPAEVWYPKPKEPGVALEFSDANVIRFPERLECIAYYDAKLYGFTKDRIYMVYGEGPSATGQGGQFSAPQLLPSVTGCENPFSMVETPQGLMFQSQMPVFPVPPATPTEAVNRSAGIWVLGQGGIQPVTQPQDFNFYPIVSASSLPKKNQALFTLWNYPSSNAMLAYDYLAQQWSTHLVTETGTNFCAGDVVDGHHEFVSDQKWYVQNQSFAAADTMKVRFPWIKPAEIVSGYGRVKWVYLLGTYKSAHTLNIKVYYDYDDTTAVETITASITSSVTPYLYRFKPARQRCNSFMVEVYDSNQAGTYESFSLDAIKVRLGPMRHQVLPASRTL